MHNKIVTLLTEEIALWRSATTSTNLYRVERQVRNKRGVLVLAYHCQCADFIIEGRHDCKHIFAEKLYHCSRPQRKPLYGQLL